MTTVRARVHGPEPAGRGGGGQQLVIRDTTAGRPLLLFVHGGPGGTMGNAWFRRFNAALAQDFTVVTWDQRGAGRTGEPPATCISRYLQDLHDVMLWLRLNFPDRGVLLVGHSWGSVLGLQYAATHPDHLLGYVGISQVIDMPRSEAHSYQWARQEAQRRGHRAALRALTRIGPPPYGAREVLTQRTWLSVLGGDQHARLGAHHLLREALHDPAFTPWDLWLHLRGTLKGTQALWPEFSAVDLSPLQSFTIPLWFAQGRHDQVTPGSILTSHVAQLRAPLVHTRWFEHSGHAPQIEEQQQFNEWLRDEVLPRLHQPVT